MTNPKTLKAHPKTIKQTSNPPLRIGLVVPHMFMHRDILPRVIFSPAQLALQLASNLQQLGAVVTLFSPGPVDIPTHADMPVRNITADVSYFESELLGRSDDYLELLKKHPQTFIALSRQVQSELLAKAFTMANNDELDVVHVYTNEEDIALPFAALCHKPVVFTHHDPFNFLVKYKNVFPKYKQLNWLSMSSAQRAGMPPDTNWVGNIYHGLEPILFTPNYQPAGDYVAYLGRIIEPKGVHLAIAAVRAYNKAHTKKIKLKIAGKHYAGVGKDIYWQQKIEPHIDGIDVEYVGYIASTTDKQSFLGNARALLVPSTFEEPFGMVMIEALACGTPLIGLDSGAIPEVITHGKTGLIIPKNSESEIINNLSQAVEKITEIDRKTCRQEFDKRFTAGRMAAEHLQAYESLIII